MLVATDDGNVTKACAYVMTLDEDCIWYNEYDYEIKNVTHFQELPKHTNY